MSSLPKSNQPFWLNQNQVQEAEVLIAIGFCYIGNVGDYLDEDELELYNCGQWKHWKFHTEYMELVLSGVCEKALYSWDLSEHPDVQKPNFLNNRVDEIKNALDSVIYSDQYDQLNLFS
jgi:hypothetical protein